MSSKGRVAIIGAGMAGLACARRLADGGADVVVIDKGRGLGGRIATRRGAFGAVDHGAVALSPAQGSGEHLPYAGMYAAFLRSAAEQGAAAFWGEVQGFVGLPGMSGIVRPLARGLTLMAGVEVTGLARVGKGWSVQGAGVPEGVFAEVVLAVPQPQAVGLLRDVPALQAAIGSAQMRAVWTAMAVFDRPVLGGRAIRLGSGKVAQAVRNSSKPGREGADEAWVLHASAEWTVAHLERGKPEAAADLLAAFFDEMGAEPVAPVWLEGHRWRYGLTELALGQAFVRDAELGLSVCGDWCLGDSACDAFVSGSALADALAQ